MRRRTIYYVGGEDAEYSLADWCKLFGALRMFHKNMHNAAPDEYHAGEPSVLPQQTFWVSRKDGRPLVMTRSAPCRGSSTACASPTGSKCGEGRCFRKVRGDQCQRP
jgi:hypothetical protein